MVQPDRPYVLTLIFYSPDKPNGEVTKTSFRTEDDAIRYYASMREHWNADDRQVKVLDFQLWTMVKLPFPTVLEDILKEG